MSKRRESSCDVKPVCSGNYGNFGNKSCCCNFPTLIILILIVLQFSKKRRSSSEGTGCGKLIDNSILFIIALFYLSCCNPCKSY